MALGNAVRGLRVVVLGGGVVGLTTAVRLLEAGARVEVLTAGPPQTSTSWLAAAVWFPTHVGPAQAVERWGRETYNVLTGQAHAGAPGVLLRQTLALYRTPPRHEPWMDAVGPVRPATPDELPPGYTHGLRFTAPLVEMPVHLPWLATYLERLGGTLRRRRVTSLAQLCGPGVDVLVNCTGLAARDLADDPSVVPVRGQLVRTTNPGLTMSVRDEHHPLGRAYVHPRSSDCILGGTLEEGRWDTEPDPAIAASIVRRCVDLAPLLAEARLLEDIVGLRPGRPAVRLEEAPSRAGTRIIHNYGHGGSGITLSWGCARHVTDIITGG